VIEKAAALVQQAVDTGQVPGAALGLIRLGEAPFMRVWGLAEREPERRELDLGAWFDLASLTKVLFTVPEVLRLVEDGLADLDDPLSLTLPELGERDLASRTLRQLLTHTAGLPASAPLHLWESTPEAIRLRLLHEPWALVENVYSDLGYLLLGLVIERLRGAPLTSRPLPSGLTFTPPAASSVSTELCEWRGRLMRGEVHDEKAFALGGPAGHAGLFGTLEGVLGAVHSLLNGTALSPAALAELRAPQTPTRALGWERRYTGWSGGSLCSPQTIGHTGFTGTGCWTDFERGYGWALLTNNVHPSRQQMRNLGPLRRAVGSVLAAEWHAG
jgi:CubicO group peptidase (beta-lactamase class C family)